MSITALAAVTATVAISVPAAQAASDVDPTRHKDGAGSHTYTALHGTGGGRLDFEGFEGDPVSFQLHGRTTQADNPTSAKGTFHVTHERGDGSPFAEFSGRLDCLGAAGDIAVVTGVIDTFDAPGMPGLDLDGRRVGFTVSDRGHGDRIGWSWAFGHLDDVPPCMSTVPFFEVEHGGFSIHD